MEYGGHPAIIRERDGVARVLDRRPPGRFPCVEVVFADQGDQGAKAAEAVAGTGSSRHEIVSRDPGTRGFAVLPKRRIVECTLSWIRRNRPLARDVEHLARPAEALVRLAMIKITPSRLAHRHWLGFAPPHGRFLLRR
ncbi:hypothetical protein [Rhodosalinus sp.]|uniref:hypothetical protein n=1 Tax=Rhodosalinus sp. TaxID=2047741 RepID=UPI003565DB08